MKNKIESYLPPGFGIRPRELILIFKGQKIKIGTYIKESTEHYYTPKKFRVV